MKIRLLLVLLILLPINTYAIDNYGHVPRWMCPSSAMQRIHDISEAGVFDGVFKRWEWRALEPSIDSYDFSLLREELELATSLGLKYAIMVQFNSHNNNPPAVPTDLLNSYYGGGVIPHANGSSTICVRWNLNVLERLDLLFTTLSYEFGEEFSFVALPESAGAPLDCNEVTAEDLYLGVHNTMTVLKKAFISTQTIQNINWVACGGGAEYLPLLGETAFEWNIGLGGPDIHPDSRIQGDSTIIEYKDDLFVVMVASPSSYSEHSIAEIYNYARYTLGSNVIIWSNHTDEYQEEVETFLENEPEDPLVFEVWEKAAYGPCMPIFTIIEGESVVVGSSCSGPTTIVVDEEEPVIKRPRLKRFKKVWTKIKKWRNSRR